MNLELLIARACRLKVITIFFFHRSYLRDKSKFRRGMVLFYRQQHAQKIAKVFSSVKFDIVWLRLATRSGLKEVHFLILFAQVMRNFVIWGM